jgi:uncharacterized membrane protein YcaP (DUF421 family)
MPTFIAVVAASVAGYLVSRVLGDHSPILGGIVSFLLWVVVFYFMKRFLIHIRP